MGNSVQAGTTPTAPIVRPVVAPRPPSLVAATQVARDAKVLQSRYGLRFATFGETGVTGVDLDRILEAVPASIGASLQANTYFFVPLALREPPATLASKKKSDHALVASAYTDEYGDAAICHRNIELGSGKRGVFISTRLLDDRFALSFEFFINVAHAFVDNAGVPAAFSDLVWKQALDNVRGETSASAWEDRNVAFGRPPHWQPESAAQPPRRPRSFAPVSRSFTVAAAAEPPALDDKARASYLSSAFSDAVAMYLLSLALDFDYAELRERDYPLLAPAALAARLQLVANLFPPNPGYDFAIKYRRRA